MIKIKLLEHNIHRNETTFRPLIFAEDLFRQIGIEFTNSNDYDFAFVGQASIINKKTSLRKSVEKGLKFLKEISGDYIIVDGQDSTSLIGTVDIFREIYNDCKLFLKTSYLKDFDLYKKGWINGRMYWGEGSYKISDIDKMKPKLKLAGFNWLSTVNPTWHKYDSNKKYDVSAMFQFPMGKEVYEHDLLQSTYYDNFRRPLIEKLKIMENKIKITRLKNGVRIPENEYYQKMYDSKIVIAPFGYGEMAPRDIQSAMFGNILLKPSMEYVDTIPNIYVDGKTYISVKHDWSDLEEKIDYVLSNFKELQSYLVENMKKRFIESNSVENRVLHLYNLFKNLDNVGI